MLRLLLFIIIACFFIIFIMYNLSYVKENFLTPELYDNTIDDNTSAINFPIYDNEQWTTISGAYFNNNISELNCKNRDYEPEILQRGEYWVLKNYIRASHGQIGCLDTITYTTHGDYSFLDNIILILER